MPFCVSHPVRLTAVLLLAAAQLPAADEAREIVRRATEAARRNQEVERNYTYVRRSFVRTLNGDGSVKRSKTETHDITFSEGTPYARLLEVDDKPLPPDRQRDEQAKLRASIEQRRNETPQQREKRIAEWEKRRKKEREFINELLDAMDFRLVGEEPIGGRAAWIIDATPHPGYRAKSSDAKFLAKVHGKMWIDKADGQAARIEAETIADIPFGGFLAKVHKGSRFVIEEVRINDEVWLPKRIQGQISARVLTFKIGQTMDLTYRDYRKFQAESRILSTDADPKQ